MEYNKPEIAPLGSAIVASQSHTGKDGDVIDSPHPTTCAYEVDE
jgi:hypothetical protein